MRLARALLSFRVLSVGVELGAGWLNVSQVTGRERLGISLSSPSLPCTIKRQLGRAARQGEDEVFALIWNAKDSSMGRLAPTGAGAASSRMARRPHGQSG